MVLLTLSTQMYVFLGPIQVPSLSLFAYPHSCSNRRRKLLFLGSVLIENELGIADICLNVRINDGILFLVAVNKTTCGIDTDYPNEFLWVI